jgi:hypothetical protein
MLARSSNVLERKRRSTKFTQNERARYTLMMVSGAAQLMADATTSVVTESRETILRLSDLDDRMMNDFSEGKMSHFILECPEGVSIPFKLDLKGEFLVLESALMAQLSLKILKTCYVRCEEKENFLFSTDLKAWKGFSEFFTGAITVSLGQENDEPVAGLQIELNQKS